MSDSLWPHELQHARPPCPSPTPRVHSNSGPSSQWCHPAISSSVVPFSFCPQSFPASESFPVSQLFASGGQSTGVSASTSVLPRNTQDWSPLGWALKSLLQGNGNPLQCSSLENPRDGGAWWAAVSGVAQSQTRPKRLSSSKKKHQRGIFLFLTTTWGHSEQALSACQEERSHQKLSQSEPWSWTSQPPELWENKLLLLSHPDTVVFCFCLPSRLIQYWPWMLD